MALIRTMARMVAAVLVAGLLSATLLRFAPGLGMEEAQLDPRWRQETLGRMAVDTAELENPLLFYFRFLSGYLRGELGVSRLLERPVAGLLAERLPATARAVALGCAVGWMSALVVSLLAVRYRRGAVLRAGATASTLAIQCIPAAVLGLLLVLAGGRGAGLCGGAIGLLLYSRLTPLVRNRLEQAGRMPHVLTARAQGAGEWRVLLRQVLPVSAPQLIAAAGVSVSMALSAAIPLETVLDVPGVGQLAWQAALGRDVYLLVNLTGLLTLAVLGANALADLATPQRGRS